MLPLVVIAIIVVIVGFVATRAIVGELRAARAEARRGRVLAILQTFGPGLAEAGRDPRALLAWEPLARAARTIAPEEMAALDAASGARFPFSASLLEQAHADWTAEWLSWELAHDAEYKLKTGEVEHELAASGGASFLRAKLEQVEREKLERYQRRYQEYVRVAKALQALTGQQ